MRIVLEPIILHLHSKLIAYLQLDLPYAFHQHGKNLSKNLMEKIVQKENTLLVLLIKHQVADLLIWKFLILNFVWIFTKLAHQPWLNIASQETNLLNVQVHPGIN